MSAETLPEAVAPTSEDAAPAPGSLASAAPDPFAMLAAIGASPAAFPDAVEEARAAARALFVRQASARGLALDGLRALHAAVGPETFAALLPEVRPGDLTRLAGACDPHKPGLAGAGPEILRAHLGGLAAGAAPTVAADIAEIDLAGLREARTRLGADDFAAWLAGLRVNEMKRALQRLDPHRPGLVGMETESLRGLVDRLSSGEEPVAAADIAEIDLAGLRAARARLGEADFATWLAALRITETKKALQRLDQHRPGLAALEGEAMRDLLDRLSAGEEPVAEVDLPSLDLDGLRAARTYLADGFPAWLAGLRVTETRKALQRVDAHRPGLAALDAEGLKAHLAALAEGAAEPAPAIPLDEVDLAGLGAAREALGTDAFDQWLAELKPADVKRTVIRLDPERPGVRKLKPAEYAEILATLAERMAPYSGRQGVPSVTEITFGRARHDEERYPDEASADEA